MSLWYTGRREREREGERQKGEPEAGILASTLPTRAREREKISETAATQAESERIERQMPIRREERSEGRQSRERAGATASRRWRQERAGKIKGREGINGDLERKRGE